MSFKQYYDPYQLQAIIMGYLLNYDNKITTANFNKLSKEAGLDPINAEELFELADYIEEDEELYSLLQETRKGNVKLEQIVKYGTEDVRPLGQHNVFQIITPHIKAKYRHQRDNREFNKLRREGAYMAILMDEMKEELLRANSTIQYNSVTAREPDFEYRMEGTTMVVGLSDWHIGATVVNHPSIGYGFNYEILLERLGKFIEEVEMLVKMFKVDNIRVYYAGDLVENTNMRNHQDFGVEFNLSAQIARAIRTVYDVLDRLQAIRPVKFGIVNGNHDRLQGDKKQKIYNDSVAYIVLDMLIFEQETGKLQNVEIIDNREAMHYLNDMLFDDEDFKIGVAHGDHLKKGDKIKQLIDRGLYMLYTGHLHSAEMRQENEGSWHVQISSIMGSNDYSAENMFGMTKPSQHITVIDKELKAPIMYNPILV